MRGYLRSPFGPLVLILIGIVFLLINLGFAPAAAIKALFAQWWPLILVISGVWLLLRPWREGRRKTDGT